MIAITHILYINYTKKHAVYIDKRILKILNKQIIISFYKFHPKVSFESPISLAVNLRPCPN